MNVDKSDVFQSGENFRGYVVERLLGKGGIGDNLIKTVSDALEARELIKLSVLETAEETQQRLQCVCTALRRRTVRGFAVYRPSMSERRISRSA